MKTDVEKELNKSCDNNSCGCTNERFKDVAFIIFGIAVFIVLTVVAVNGNIK